MQGLPASGGTAGGQLTRAVSGAEGQLEPVGEVEAVAQGPVRVPEPELEVPGLLHLGSDLQ